MTVDTAKCPHCGTRLSGDEIEKLEVDGGRTVPMMGTNKSADDELFVCPSCDVILG